VTVFILGDLGKDLGFKKKRKIPFPSGGLIRQVGEQGRNIFCVFKKGGKLHPEDIYLDKGGMRAKKKDSCTNAAIRDERGAYYGSHALKWVQE